MRPELSRELGRFRSRLAHLGLRTLLALLVLLVSLACLLFIPVLLVWSVIYLCRSLWTVLRDDRNSYP